MAGEVSQAESASYATLDAYETYFGDVATADEERVTSLLAKASERLAELVSEYGIDEQAKAAALEEVCCNMVARRMRAAAAAPLASVSMQAAGFMETMSYAVPSRVGWQLYPEDYDELGITTGGIACVRPWRDE